MNFLKKLDYMMQKNNLTKSELSRISGVPYTTIDGFYKKGYENVKLSTARKISKALHVTLDYLLDESIENELDYETDSDKKAPFLSDGALQLAKDYESMDSHGRNILRTVADEELNRMEKLAELAELNPERERKVINLFSEPSAAGLATPVEGKDYESYELSDNDPQGAAYAVRIRGNSMEPAFADGAVVFVNHDAIREGDIGIFCVDGGTVCKQYYQRGGVVYLFSLNRNRADADVVLFPDSNRSFVCQGRVITKQRYPLPHER